VKIKIKNLENLKIFLRMLAKKKPFAELPCEQGWKIVFAAAVVFTI